MFCLIGDGESAEGSIWEAMHFASKYNLDNLVAIFDVNRLGQSEATSIGHDMDVYKARCEAFGWLPLYFLFFYKTISPALVASCCQVMLTNSWPH